MRGNIREFVRVVAETLPILQPVVEVGALQVPDQPYSADLRPFFAQTEYIGCDIRPGPGVDRIEDVHQLSFAADTLGTVLMLETLEHVRNPLQAMSEVFRVLRPGGLAVISSCMDFPVHEHPADYWRFAPQGFDLLLERFIPRQVYVQGVPVLPHSLAGVGLKPGPTDSDSAHWGRFAQRVRTIPGTLTQEVPPEIGPDLFRLLDEEPSAAQQARWYPVPMLHNAYAHLLQKEEEIARLHRELRALQHATRTTWLQGPPRLPGLTRMKRWRQKLRRMFEAES